METAVVHTWWTGSRSCQWTRVITLHFLFYMLQLKLCVHKTQLIFHKTIILIILSTALQFVRQGTLLKVVGDTSCNTASGRVAQASSTVYYSHVTYRAFSNKAAIHDTPFIHCYWHNAVQWIQSNKEMQFNVMHSITQCNKNITPFCSSNCRFQVNLFCLQCCDTVGWASGQASSL